MFHLGSTNNFSTIQKVLRNYLHENMEGIKTGTVRALHCIYLQKYQTEQFCSG